ncbi:phospholipase A2 group XV isoform X2 [Xenopus laevis]|uniref:Phospholipase A2 group XV isoform X2 n=1 Tax=Xenopus laevis TaxID=8355 RepID=A0A8J1MVX5_XENLA|nr:phospholipase A2 group XV isoform X2 [Xenopus laevis]
MDEVSCGCIRVTSVCYARVLFMLLFSVSGCFSFPNYGSSCGVGGCSPGPPVVLVPGDLGNQLEAKLDKPSVVHYMCSKKTNYYFTLWLNLELLLPVVIDCWIDNIRSISSISPAYIEVHSILMHQQMEIHHNLMCQQVEVHSKVPCQPFVSQIYTHHLWSIQQRLVYNKTSKTTAPPEGVDIRVPGFGQTYSLEFLDPSKRSVGSYFYTLVQSLVDWGYTRDENVRGVPYDWRKAPNENSDYFVAVRKLVESMFESYQSPVVLIAHSMGNLYTLYFLNQQTQDWKDKYIHSFVALGAPWGGVSKTLHVLASGDNNRIPVISSLRIRDQQRSAVSTNWLLPYNNTWQQEKVFVITPNKNYTIKDYRMFYEDIGFQDGWEMRKETEGLVSSLTPPGVEVHCLYGTGVDTPDSFSYDSFPDKEPTTVYGEGDGTVNLESALQCGKWRNQQRQKVSLVELPGNEHIAMLSNISTISYVKKVLFGL